MGFDLVQIRLLGSGGKRTLQIMAEPKGGGAAMTLDHCAEISRAVSAVLDVADPLPGGYVLEVSSPGIDRPLVRLRDFERYAGFEARLELNEPIDGKKRLRGRLNGVVEGDLVALNESGTERQVPFATIGKAKLVLTDDLIKASAVSPEALS